jgi:hypothetical protein
LLAGSLNHDSVRDCRICGANTYMDEEGWPGRSCKGCGILNHLHDYATDAAKHDSQSDCEVDNWVIIAPTAFVIILLGTFAFVKYRHRKICGSTKFPRV